MNTVTAADTAGRTLILEKAAHTALLYFDFFGHPLTAAEVHRYSPVAALSEEISEALDRLEKRGIVECCNGFYSPGNAAEAVARRRVCEVRARRDLPRALLAARFIARFPFVRGVYISGSLSKGVQHPDGDCDFFIITASGRLWICRTLLVLFKKIFLLNSRKYFCINYFIDEHNLAIPDENIYVAVELATLISGSNTMLLRELLMANRWISRFLPNAQMKFAEAAHSPQGRPTVRRTGIFARFADGLDDFCCRLTVRRWRRKFGALPPDDFAHAFRSTKTVSKCHPLMFQKKVLAEMERRMLIVENQAIRSN